MITEEEEVRTEVSFNNIVDSVDDKEGIYFANFDFEEFSNDDWDNFSLRDVKTGSKGTTASVYHEGKHVKDLQIEYGKPISSDILLKYMKRDMKRKFIKRRTAKVAEDVELDSVDESLLTGAKASQDYNRMEVLRNKGFTRGAIIERFNGGHRTYGIFTGEFYQSDDDTIGLKFTDGSSWHESFCTLMDDVNKDILRMVSAEQGRILEDAQQFVALIDRKVNEIVYGV